LWARFGVNKNGHDIPELELLVASTPHEDGRHEPKFASEPLEVILGMVAAEVRTNTATLAAMDEELASLRADVNAIKKHIDCLPEVLDLLRTISARV
jgi:hypothetical protein